MIIGYLASKKNGVDSELHSKWPKTKRNPTEAKRPRYPDPKNLQLFVMCYE